MKKKTDNRAAINIRVSPLVHALVREAAYRAGTKPSDYCRQAIHLSLTMSGLDPAPPQEKA
jgi:uncharacterized protein (DUF1778 family)